MLISRVAELITPRTKHLTNNLEIRTLLFDSRKAKGQADELFVALVGQQNDGHAYIQSLYNKGVRSFLISQEVHFNEYPLANFLIVKNTLASLQELVSAYRAQFKIPVIGITGSNGKTIVKEWLSTILSESKQLVKSPKSYNSQIGVPLSVWEINDSHEVAVFEAGISTSNEMEKLERIIQPTIGIFTNIGEAHDAGFENRTQKLEEKGLLFDHTQTNICRFSHEHIRQMLSQKLGKLVTWDLDNPAATINILKKNGQYIFEYCQHPFALQVSTKNPQNLENTFHAVAGAVVFGTSAESIQHGLNKLKAVPMRLELKRGLNDTYILDDTYNNDLKGLEIALDYLLQQPQKQGKVVVLSDILQSGKPDSELYQQVNVLLEKHHIDLLIGIGSKITQARRYFSMLFKAYSSAEVFIKTAPEFTNQTILVKGARDFHLEGVVSYLEEKSHGTVLEVNYESLLHNLKAYQSRLNAGTKLMVMVKAFAYGIGVDEVAHLLQYHQVDYLGVAYLDEAINLRRKGIQLPIMIMNVDWESFSLVETFGLEPEIYSLSMLKRFLKECNNPPPIHLKIETGMNRLGFVAADIPELVVILQENPTLKVAGIFTHFSSAEDAREDAFTQKQVSVFEQIYNEIRTYLAYQPMKHVLNSAGLIRWPQYHFDMVRLGIGLYGFDSSKSFDGLKPVGILKSKISQIKNVSKGDTIGYSRKGKIEKEGKIAIVAIGYADGYSRTFGNGNAYMLINRQRAYTIGNICMDMTMLDVSTLEVNEGDEVIVFGENPSIQDLANWSNTIPYEILTNISQRVKRVFISE